MSKYFLLAIILQGCPWSMKAQKLLLENNYNCEIQEITYEQKDNWKEKMNTFPQIYLKKHNSKGSTLIGGFTELNNMHNVIKKSKSRNACEKELKKTFPDMKYKKLLRLIELTLKTN